MADLTTLARLKGFLHISHSNFDTMLAALIVAASAAIDDYCGRHLASDDYSEYLDGGGNKLVLKQRPVTSVAGIYEDSGRAWPESSQLSTDAFIVNEGAGIITRVWGTFPSGIGAIKIIYTAGYSTIPEALAQACLLVCASWYQRSREGQQRMGDSITLKDYPEEIGPVAGELLQPYRELAA